MTLRHAHLANTTVPPPAEVYAWNGTPHLTIKFA